METKKLTPKQYLKLHPDKYVMVTYEFGKPIFIAPLKDLQIQVTPNRNEAETWSELDNTPTKLEYHIIATGYKGLKFEKISPAIKQYTFTDLNDIKQFFNDIHQLYPLEWHPDDDFHFFMKEDNVTRAFTDEEAEYLNKVMVDCFQYCDDSEFDVYDIASQVQVELWKAQGKWRANK